MGHVTMGKSGALSYVADWVGLGTTWCSGHAHGLTRRFDSPSVHSFPGCNTWWTLSSWTASVGLSPIRSSLWWPHKGYEEGDSVTVELWFGT